MVIKEEKQILSDNLFPVVGIGASAGGLDSFKLLIKSIPDDSGMAFILVQHLHPDYISTLPDILQRESRIPVLHITDRVTVQPDHIYIIPPNKSLVANGGILELTDRSVTAEKYLPIDLFLSSLAEIHREHAIGIILSGSGSDGTIGLKTIKDYGGITIAQEPGTAQYVSMPQSAIQNGFVDFVLAPEKMAEHIINLKSTYENLITKEDKPDETIFRKIIVLLRTHSGVDFTYYKQSTIRRRIIRRMLINHKEKLQEYYKQLLDKNSELDLLFQDLLIPVTSFFRDEESFEVLCSQIFPELIKDKSTSNPIRIWVAGCSYGHEAYSLAMCIHEFLGDKISAYKIQIFATDLSPVAINHARLGVFDKKELANVSDERTARFFTRIDGHFHIKKKIRDMVVFATHNFLTDPPFANLDLITCRNVLIYMENFLQKKAFNTFHYALKDKKFLMLGKSESPGINSDLFLNYNKNDKIYIKKVSAARNPVLIQKALVDSQPFELQQETVTRKDDLQKLADEILLSRFSPPGVIVNAQYDIVQFRGSTGAFLEPSPGKASLNVLKMAREGLAFEIRNALHKAKAGKSVIKEHISVSNDTLVTIEVIPVEQSIEKHYLILFKEEQQTTKSDKKNKNVKHAKDSNSGLRVEQLEKDLAHAREGMRSITEDQEAINEELQSANEELLSGAEELQSLNEELEAGKEELQSTNEELLTINQELFDRNEQYNRARLYSEAIVRTVHEPLLVLNSELKIRSANKAFFNVFQITEEQTYGKSIIEIQDGVWLTGSLQQRLISLKSQNDLFLEWEEIYIFPGLGKRHLSINAQPVSTEKEEFLILLAIDDISLKKKAANKIQEFSDKLETQVNELEISNKKLEQYASVASHDLQEPLRKIQTFAKVLEQRHSADIPPPMKLLLEKIVQASQRMSLLIKDVLNFSRIINLKDGLQKTDLNEILKNVLNDYDLLIDEKNAIVHTGHLPVIDAHPLLINQLFYNLLNNSLKYTNPDIQPEITISSRMISNDKLQNNNIPDPVLEYCEISFTDNGIGFNEEYAEQIFMLFERLHTEAEYSGTGIGLALCNKIVAIHQGEIKVKSSEGAGTTFYIILPVNLNTEKKINIIN